MNEEFYSSNFWDEEDCYSYYNEKFDFVSRYVKGRILDAGCNQAWFYNKYPHKKNVVNMDFVKRKVPNFRKGKITSIPFRKDSFDTVLCLDVLEHLPKGDDLKALDELFRVGKRIIVSTAFSNSRVFRKTYNLMRRILGVNNTLLVGHYREYYEESFNELLKKKGRIIDSCKISIPYGILSDFFKNNNIYYTKVFVVDKKKY